MSFALEYRKRLLEQQRQEQAEAARKARDPDPFTVTVADAVETPRNRRRVLAALVVAALVLTTFNSGALVHYARGLADGPMGPQLIALSETWHDMMTAGRMTRITEEVRARVADVRQISWQDLQTKLRVTMFAAMQDGAVEADPQADPLATGSIDVRAPRSSGPKQAGADSPG